MTAPRAAAVLAAFVLFALPIRAQIGDLRIVSQPGVQVLWEGVDLGVTGEAGELLIEEIPLGTYSLLLMKPGHESLETAVTISEGRTTVSLQLEATRSGSVRETGAESSPPSDPAVEETAEAVEPSSRNARQTPSARTPDADGTSVSEGARPTAATDDKAAARAPVHNPATTETDRKTPAQPASSPAPVTTPAAKEESGSRLLVTLAIAAGLVGALLFWTRARSARAGRSAPAVTTAADEPPTTDAAPSDEPDISPLLREQLRRREASLETEPPRRRPSADAEIIDVADFEVIEGEQ